MFGSTILDVAIGLVLVYCIYGLFASILQELIASHLLNLRSKVLELAIARMLEDGNKLSRFRLVNIYQFLTPKFSGGSDKLSAKFYGHPLIKFLGENNKTRKPTYITSETFSKVLIDLLRGMDVKPGDDIKNRIQTSLDQKQNAGKANVQIDQETLSFLNSVWADAQGDIDKFKVILEKWFNETMDRASGWYKKYTQIILLVIGLAIAMAFNVNTIEIVHKLEKDPVLRGQMVAQADIFLKAHPNLDKELALALNEDSIKVKRSDGATIRRIDSLTIAQYDTLKARRDTLINMADRLVKADMERTNNLLGLGWNGWCNFFHTLFHTWSIFGWLMTAVAISLGAPFWFDLLNKMMKLRSSVAIGTGDTKKNELSDANKTTIDRKG